MSLGQMLSARKARKQFCMKIVVKTKPARTNVATKSYLTMKVNGARVCFTQYIAWLPPETSSVF
jgi:hypothetical protein